MREAAEQATQDEWVAYILPGHNGIYPARTSEGRHCGYFIDWPGVCQGRESISIRTYAVNCNDAWLNTEGDDISGSYVKYKDHQEVVAALEAKCAALAAENAGLKSGAMGEIEVINRGGQAYCVKDGVQVNPMYARGWNDYRAKSLQSDTPATDAFLAEIERKAIRKFINSIEHILRDKLSPYDTEEMLEAMRIFLEEQEGEQKWRSQNNV
ncbi:ead/Ea22-like family protein [Escherichia coli]